ncbi:amino acid adenylation domain-containing protein [Endothiovibrio diazotrophicus]
MRLSFAQQRLWFLDQLEAGGATYNMPIAVRLTGPLDRAALHRALQTIVDRHDALRTTIADDEGEPWQRIAPRLELELPLIDLAARSPSRQEADLADLMREEATAFFDLANDPLIRARLVLLGPRHHVLLITMHHIISDGWSMGRVFLTEFTRIYDALIKGETPTLAPLAIQYADYSAWQGTHLAGERLEKLSNYWVNQLRGLPPLLELPTDRARPAVQTHRGDVYHFRVEPALLTRIKQLAQANGASLFMVLLAGFACLLGRYSRQNDFAIGSPVAGRNRKELEPLIGLFVNSLALRMRPEGQRSATDFIQQVRQTCLQAFAHQEMPFERLVEIISPERATSFSPLFQVMFILQNQNAERTGLTCGGMEISSIPVDAASAMFDLTLKLEEQGGVLLGELEFNTDLFDGETVARMMGYLLVVWQAMAERPDTPLNRISLLSDDETARTLRELRSSAWPSYGSGLLERIAEQAAARPDRLAVSDGERSLTYGELLSETDRLAKHLRGRGLLPEQRVGVCLQRRSHLLPALLGVLRSGCAYVPIDPAFPLERIASMVEQGELSLLITDRLSQENLPADGTPRLEIDAGLGEVDDAVALPAILPDQLAYVIFTSGSTGKPKGVQISHAALLNFLTSMLDRPGLGSGDRLAAVTTVSFDIAGLELFLPLLAGAGIELIDRDTAADGYALLARLEACGANVMQATPATWRMLLATGAERLPLARVFCGGEALDAELATALAATGVEIWNLYGPTETTIWSTAGAVRPAADGSAAAPDLGRAINGTSLYILDDALQPCAVGLPGELYIGGLSVSRGYAGQPALTAERFLPDPYGPHPGSRMYRTGDLVVQRHGGRLDYLGRADFQIKLRGYRIELGEIESVLKAHPAVQHAVAVTRRMGADDQLVAYVETTPEWLEGPARSAKATEQWRMVWNETYGETGDGEEQDDFSGWLSSIDGQPMGKGPMTRWADETAHRILQLSPKRVLEIGCGTGIIARRLVEAVEHYHGIDFSAEALQQTQRRLARQGQRNFSLSRCAASEIPLDGLSTVDTVVINSVAQYFPSLSYLAELLDRLEPALSPAATIFLGDLRHLGLLDLLHTRIQLHGAEPSMPARELLDRVRSAVREERELLFAPTAFHDWRIAGKRPTAAGVQLKPAGLDPELGDFRYDLVLQLDSAPDRRGELPRVEADPADPSGSLDTALRQYPQGFRIGGLPNTRLHATHATLRRLEGADPELPLHEIVRDEDRLDDRATDSLQQYEAWARNAGVDLRIAWDTADATRLQALVQPSSNATADRWLWLEPGEEAAEPTNQPAVASAEKGLTQALMAQLREKLPAYMVPATLVVMERLPLTPNGKIDRAALPTPDAVLKHEAFVAPATPLEIAIAEIWSEILGRSPIGSNDNFFHLGGHSLLAVQVIARLRERVGHAIPLQRLFDAPTIAEFARQLEGAEETTAAGTDLVALPPERRRRGPLTHQQRQLWFIDQLHGPNPTYHVGSVVRVHGPLDLSALEQSIRLIVRRHDALRTNYPVVDGEPLALVHDEPTFGWSVATATDQVTEQRLVQAALVAPFDLATDPLLRCQVVQLDDRQYVLALTLHHIIADEWSIAVFQQELAAFYPRLREGSAPQTELLAIQYADYTHWRDEQARSAAFAASEDFWQECLRDAPRSLELPGDRPRPAQLSAAGALYHASVDAELSERLKRLSVRQGVTLFMSLLTGWSILLARRAGIDDLVIGVPMSDRSRPELERLIGFFVNTLPLRIDLAGNPSSAELLQRVRERSLQVMAHQGVPFDRIVELVQPERSLSHSPLFQVVFVLQNAPKAELAFGGLELELLPNDAAVSKFDVTLSVEENDDRLDCVVEYSTELFDEATIAAMMAELKLLWRGMADAPDAPVATLALLDPARLHSVLALPNPPLDATPANHDPLGGWRAHRTSTPEQPALAHGDLRVSHRQLDHWSEQIARQLAPLHLESGSVIGIHCEPEPVMVATMLAVLKAGFAYLPIVPGTPPRRVEAMLGAARCAVVFDAVGDLETAVQRLQPAAFDPSDTPETPPRPAPAAASPACVIFTSGSTGEPKAVAISYGNLAASVEARLHHYPEAMTGLLLLQPFNFDVATGSILWSLNAGGCLHLEPRATALDPERLLERIERSRVSHLVLLPLLYQPVLALARPDQLAAVRCVLVGGEAMPADLPVRHAATAPQASLYNEYGPTETTVMCAAHRVDTTTPRLRQPIGKALGRSRLYVLDEHLSPLPVGVTGELCVGGPQVSLGYLGRPAATAASFVPDPFGDHPGARLYRTGDRARLNRDGTVELQGREDEQVKIRGHRIEPGEVESAIAGIGPVAEVAVRAVAVGDSKALAAYVVYDRPDALSEEQLRRELAERLPDYMLPQAILILERLPRTANGKLDHRALPAIAPRANHFSLPESDAERRMSEIWCRVLGRPAVGRHDNFFALGGDSILTIQVVSRARRGGFALTAKQLFEHQTIAELCAVVTLTDGGAERHQDEPQQFAPTPIQQWFLARYGDAPDHFNQSLMLRISHRLDDALLTDALAALQRRHPMLGVRLGGNAGDGWRLDYRDAPPPQLESITVDGPAALTAEAERLQASLSLRAGPIWRAARFTGLDGDDRLLVVIHHIAVDGVSWRILAEDLEAALGAGGQLAASASHGFGAWAQALDAYRIPESHREYWLAAAAPTAIPLDHAAEPAQHNLHGAQATLEFTLPEALGRALAGAAPKALRAGIQDLLLTALQHSFAEWSGDPLLGVTLESHGRQPLTEGLDISHTVGWFTAAFPLRLEADPAHGPIERLRRVRQARQRIPLDGIEFGLLRYRDPDPAVREQLAAAEHQPVSFNYLGQFNQEGGSAYLLGEAPEPVGTEHGVRGPRPHLIDINGYFSDGRLQLFWTYCPALHREETVTRLAEGMQRDLERLVDAAQADAARSLYVPADFPLARLAWADTEALFQLAGNRVAKAFPLTPMQQGMLFHSEIRRDGGAYIVQFVCDIHGALDPARFRAAWQRTLERHDALRICVLPREEDDPLQLVVDGVDLPWREEEWRGRPQADQEDAWQALLAADRQRGFDPQTAPLMRCTLTRLGDDAWRLLWSQHHVISDGWCLPIILGDVLEQYRGLGGETLPPAPPPPSYERYVEWLAARDEGEARAFWGGYLAGLERPSLIGRHQDGAAPEAFERVERSLPAALGEALSGFARDQQATLSNLVELAIGTLIGRWTRRNDIVFGTTVSGRPAELAGVERMVGLFINSVPIRLRWSAPTAVAELLQSLQHGQRERMPFEFLPLVEVSGLAGFGARQVPFDCLCVFENYPVDESLGEQPLPLAFRNVQALEQTNVPATLTVQPGARIQLTLLASNHWFEPGAADTFMTALGALLEGLPNHAASSVDDWANAALGTLDADLERLRPHRPDLAMAAPEATPEAVYEAPAGTSEETVAGYFAKVLETSAVGRNDDFFELGGHSLLAGRLASRLSTHFDIEVPIAAVFDHGTVRGIAQYIDNQLWATREVEELAEDEEEFLL